MVCLAVVLTGCGLNLGKKVSVPEVKKEEVHKTVNNIATRSQMSVGEEAASTTVDAVHWLKYDSKNFSEKFLYPSNLVFYEFADGMGSSVTFYEKSEYEKNKCHEDEDFGFSCWKLPVVIGMHEFGFVDEQDKEQVQKGFWENPSKGEKIKIGNYDAYLTSGKSSSGYDVMKIYIPDYNGFNYLSEFEFTMVLNNKYTKDDFMAIIKSLQF